MPTASIGNMNPTSYPNHYSTQQASRSLNMQHINSNDFSSAAAAAAVCHLANLSTAYAPPQAPLTQATTSTTQPNFTIQSTNIFNNFAPNGPSDGNHQYPHTQSAYKQFATNSQTNMPSSLRHDSHSNNTNTYSTSQINSAATSKNDLIWNHFHVANTPLSNQNSAQYVDGLQYNLLRNFHDTRTQYAAYSTDNNSIGATTSPSSLSSNGSSPSYNTLAPTAATSAKFNTSPKFMQQSHTTYSTTSAHEQFDSPSNGKSNEQK
jgi:hypothetical protein